MDFSSEYILLEEEEETPQYVDSDSDDEGPMMVEDASGFECEIMNFEDEEEKAPKAQPRKKINPNNVCLKMQSLIEKPEQILPMSQLVKCTDDDCDALLSYIDRLESDNEGHKMWICKFCGKRNIVPESVGQVEKQDVLYVDSLDTLPDMNAPCDEETIIFVVDVSGSMCQTMEVAEEILSSKLKEIYKKERDAERMVLQLQNGGEQLGQGQLDSGSFHVKRLQAVKAVVLESLDYLKVNQPNVKIGMVIFNDKVRIIGSGQSVTEVSDTQLEDQAQLFQLGFANGELSCASESADRLINFTERLMEGGQTALGPALIIAEGMAMSSRTSKIILCTDGFANVGIGKLENTPQRQIDKFYEEVIYDAKRWGISLSVICFDDCGLVTKLGEMPNETGGIVEKIKATETPRLLGEELKRKTFAKNGALTIVVNKNMYIQVDSQGGSQETSFSKDIGNVHEQKSIAFSFAFPSPQSQQDGQQATANAAQQGAETTQVSIASGSNQDIEMSAEPQSYPFQTQITFTDMKGVKACRIWTISKPLTKSRSTAESGINIETAVSNFLQKSAEDILNGSKKMKEVRVLTRDISTEIQDYLTKIRGQQGSTMMNKLTTFSDVVRGINMRGSVSENDAATLRQYQANRSVGAS